MSTQTVRIGIAGPMGAGKSAAAKHLIDRGFAVIDADREAKRIMAESDAVKTGLAAAFGPAVVKNGTIDFPVLAAAVFTKENGLDALNAIVRIPVATGLSAMIAQLETDTVLDAALIPFWEIDTAFDGCLWIDAPRAFRIERLVSRGHSVADATTRIESQAGMLLRPDGDNWLFIENTGTLDELREAVDEAIDYFREDECE